MIGKLSLRNLLRNPRRSLTLIITIALGTGALFLYHGFNFGIMNQYRKNTIHARYGHGQLNLKDYRKQIYEKPWEHWIENFDEVKNQLQREAEIEYIFPRIEFYALLTNGKINVSGRGQGIDAEVESKFFDTLNVVDGKNLSKEADGIILGKGLADSLNLKINERVTIMANTIYGSLNAIDLTVTGIFHTGAKDFDDVVFRLPLAQTKILLDTNKVEAIALGLKNDEPKTWDKLALKLTEKFPALEATSFNILDKIYYQHAVDFLEAQFNSIRLIILVIVILSILNTISTSILERKQEIGNLRANGESRLEIMVLLISESLVIGFIGGLIGIILSYLLNFTLLKNGILMPPSPGLTRQFHVFIELQFSYALITILLGILSTLVGTIVSGMKVTKTEIGELLRSI